MEDNIDDVLPNRKVRRKMQREAQQAKAAIEERKSMKEITKMERQLQIWMLNAADG